MAQYDLSSGMGEAFNIGRAAEGQGGPVGNFLEQINQRIARRNELMGGLQAKTAYETAGNIAEKTQTAGLQSAAASNAMQKIFGQGGMGGQGSGQGGIGVTGGSFDVAPGVKIDVGETPQHKQNMAMQMKRTESATGVLEKLKPTKGAGFLGFGGRANAQENAIHIGSILPDLGEEDIPALRGIVVSGGLPPQYLQSLANLWSQYHKDLDNPFGSAGMPSAMPSGANPSGSLLAPHEKQYILDQLKQRGL